MRFWRGVIGAIIGVTPGLILVLLAQFVIEGEWQLTVGAAGVLLGGGGAVVGFVLGLSRRTTKPVNG
jgi:hypothetical protein